MSLAATLRCRCGGIVFSLLLFIVLFRIYKGIRCRLTPASFVLHSSTILSVRARKFAKHDVNHPFTEAVLCRFAKHLRIFAHILWMRRKKINAVMLVIRLFTLSLPCGCTIYTKNGRNPLNILPYPCPKRTHCRTAAIPIILLQSFQDAF